MNTLNEEQYQALRFAYSQGYIDAHDVQNHFDKVISNWFGDEEAEEVEDDDE